MTWPAYQSTVRDLDALFREAYALDQQREQQLQLTGAALTKINTVLTNQQKRIREVASRLVLSGDPLGQTTPPPIQAGGVDHDVRCATSESTACDQALTDLEKHGSQSLFLPEWSDEARSALVGAIFAVLPVLAVIGIQIAGFWSGILWLLWWGIAAAIAIALTYWTYQETCTPPLRQQWRESSDGTRYLHRIRTELEDIGFVTCVVPSGLIMLYKIFF